MKSYFDLAGDGGSGVLEQVTEQRRAIAQSLREVRSVVAVGSGKGGVGKSTVTMLLARSFTARGLDCAILDADINGPSQARLAGLRSSPLVPAESGRLCMPRTAGGLGVVSVGSLVPEQEQVDFTSVAEGDSHVWRATREFAFLGQLLASVDWGELDCLFVDLPPGAERTQQFAEFFGADACFVLVTIPSELARGVVARSVAALSKLPNRVLGYIENMSGYYCQGCEEVRPLFPRPAGSEVVELALPLLARLPFDPELAAACDRAEQDRLTDLPSMASLGSVSDELVRTIGLGASEGDESPLERLRT